MNYNDTDEVQADAERLAREAWEDVPSDPEPEPAPHTAATVDGTGDPHEPVDASTLCPVSGEREDLTVETIDLDGHGDVDYVGGTCTCGTYLEITGRGTITCEEVPD